MESRKNLDFFPINRYSIKYITLREGPVRFRTKTFLRQFSLSYFREEREYGRDKFGKGKYTDAAYAQKRDL